MMPIYQKVYNLLKNICFYDYSLTERFIWYTKNCLSSMNLLKVGEENSH